MSKESHEQKMSRFSRIHYLHRSGDFSHLDPIEFETWLGEMHLDDNELYIFRERRKILLRICNAYLKAYINGDIAMTGKKGLLSSLQVICGSNDKVIIGYIMYEAIQHSPKKRRGPSKINDELKREVKFFSDILRNGKDLYLLFTNSQQIQYNGETINYPGQTSDEKNAIILDRYKKLGFESLVPNPGTIKELTRNPRSKK